MLRPLDVYVCLYICTLDEDIGFERLADSLEIGVGTAHRAIARLKSSGLMVDQWTVNKKALLELVVYGIRYVYYVKPGPVTRGLPTADAAPPLNAQLSPAELPFVWPDPTGTSRGLQVEPLHKSAARVARRRAPFYELLALTDAIRLGQARVRGLAKEELTRRLTT